MVEETLAELPFERALAELEAVVQRLESGVLTLEETVALYARGRELARHCQSLLDEADLRLQQLAPDGAGGYVTTPLVITE